MKRNTPILFIAVVLISAVFFGRNPTLLSAQTCAKESEPNDEPASANVITTCIRGIISEEDQDLYWLDVTDATQRYTIELSGMREGLTTVQIVLPTLNSSGDVTDLEQFATLRVFNGAVDNTPPFMLQPGRYILGVAAANAVGEYQVAISSAAVSASAEIEPNDESEIASPISTDSTVIGSLDEETDDYFRWTVTDNALWHVSLQTTINKEITLDLYDAELNFITHYSSDEWGYADFYDLYLTPGDYYFYLRRGNPDIPYTITISADAAPSPTREAEPNDDRERANQWLESSISGRLTADNRADYFFFTDTRPDETVDIALTTTARGNHELCLYDQVGTILQCRDGVSEVVLPELVFSAENITYTIGIYSNSVDPDQTYTLERIVTGDYDPTRESEPNDTFPFADPIPENGRIEGQLLDGEWDYFRLTVPDRVQLWRIQVLGEVSDFRLLASNGSDSQYGEVGERRSRFSNLVLPIGDHYFALRGSGEYRLLARSLGDLPDGFEVEPNDNPNQTNPLIIDQQRSGIVNSLSDRDHYAFTLATASNVQLTLTPPSDADYLMALFWERSEIARVRAGEPGELLSLNVALAAGHYQVGIWADGAPSADLYTLDLEQLSQYVLLDDLEPLNNDVVTAPLLPATLTLSGTLPTGDTDSYLLPTLSKNTGLTIDNPTGADVRVYDLADNRLELDIADDGTLTTVEPLQADTNYYLYLSQGIDYDLTLEFSDGIEAALPPEPLDATLTLALDQTALAAFWTTAQQVSGTLTIESAVSAELTLQSESNHPNLSLNLPDSVAVTANSPIVLPIVLTSAADLPEGDFTISIAARTENLIATDGQSVSASAETLPLNQTQKWPLPDSLVGSFNAAASYFGAKPVQEDDDLYNRQLNLHDGSTALGQGFRWSFPISLTVDLAGDAPLDILGIALNPQSNESPLTRLQNFDLYLSADGNNFDKVYSGALSTENREQSFELEAATAATHARIVLRDTQRDRGTLSLGEWKVLTSQTLSSTVNLLDPAIGGYIVNFQPTFHGTTALNMLLPNDKSGTQRTLEGEQFSFSVGFMHNRSAQLDRLIWLPDLEKDEALVPVTVAISNDSLIGPWRTIGTFAPQDGGLQFEEDTWARFVRFSYPPSTERTTNYLPQQVKILERPGDDAYRSILAEWGHYNRSATYEWLNPPQPRPATLSADSNDSLESADPLPITTVVRGEVQVQEDSDWYAVDVSGEANAVVFSLSGEPTVDTRLHVVDASGNTLPMQVNEDAANQHTITVTVSGDSTIYARVEEPPRSIMFVWDYSGSVSPYFQSIYGAVNAFTKDVVPGREAVNYVVLGMQKPLLENWSDDPIILQRELTNYPRNHDNSSAESGLFVATNALAFRDGVKAIVLIADAEAGTNGTDALWRALEAVQPRIFTMHVHSSHEPGRNAADYQDRMQSWADVNSGYYDWFRTPTQLDNGFARATTWLRRPKLYALSADLATIVPPGPGTLQVLSSAAGDDAQAAADLLGDTAVELIIDASGSMQQMLDGSTRIEVARTVLDDLVANVLPDGVPVALRAFGNREGDFSCRSDLEIPLAPLNREQLRATIAAIQPQTNANTAIGASLALVTEDLAAATGPRLVILLTDGEETCDGDPAATIEALRADGVDVRVNIVGFAIDNAELKATFEQWAQIGGGQYFDAINAEELTTSVAQALRVPFRVLDSDGVEVAPGVVDGTEVELPAGVYTVELLTDPQQSYEVIVVGEEITTLGVVQQ